MAVAALAAKCAQKLDAGILWWLLWRLREVPGGTGRLLWGFLRLGSHILGALRSAGLLGRRLFPPRETVKKIRRHLPERRSKTRDQRPLELPLCQPDGI